MKNSYMEVKQSSNKAVEYSIDEIGEMYGVLTDGMFLEELHRLLCDFQGLYVSIFGVLPRIKP